jgi:hypothetical protein
VAWNRNQWLDSHLVWRDCQCVGYSTSVSESYIQGVQTALVHFRVYTFINNVQRSTVLFQTLKVGCEVGRNSDYTWWKKKGTLLKDESSYLVRNGLHAATHRIPFRGDYLAHLPSQLHWETMTGDIRFIKPNEVPASETSRWRMVSR